MNFELASSYKPQGDQGQAIAKLLKSINSGNKHQTLLGVTGSGKTFTMANVIAQINRPILLISHNKTLAAQLYSELKNFFPNNAVEYFVSYFDYYQPEAYIPRTDTYIEKDSSINDEIERLRLSAMGALLSRRDVIVVASVSCIYGLGSPEDYSNMMVPVLVGMTLGRDEFLAGLVAVMFERNDFELGRGKFRVRGDVVDVHPADSDDVVVRIEFFGDEIEKISLMDSVSGKVHEVVPKFTFFPAKQFVTPRDKVVTAMRAIRQEAKERVAWFEKNGKLIEAQRIKMRTDYDLEMLDELGFCQGIENYSRHLTGREPGAQPYTLLDFFPKDFLTFIDESHASVPQIGAMYEGDKSRKTVLVEHGFRLPSALDNRPLRFEEFVKMNRQFVYISATPSVFELMNCRPDNLSFIDTKALIKDKTGTVLFDKKSIKAVPSRADESVESFDTQRAGIQLIVEQVIRPTGLLDPILKLRPLKNQIDETIELCRQRIEKNERVLVTTLTKKTAEDLAEYLRDVGLRVGYIHADIGAIERVEILRELRAKTIDVLVGINLLREGLDLPEVSLVCILDADKEGFLRNETSLIQTAGRAARHINGECVLFCDVETDSIKKLIEVTNSRRVRQEAYNKQHKITPKSVQRAAQESLHLHESISKQGEKLASGVLEKQGVDFDVVSVISDLEDEMRQAASRLDFERAAHIRDQILQLKAGTTSNTNLPAGTGSISPKITKPEIFKRSKKPGRPPKS